ncbi:32379_t:CDS:2, partial [Gigaspora margarita]
MSIEKENRYHDVSLNFSSDEYDKSDDNDPTINKQDKLQNATSLSSVSTKKHNSLVWQWIILSWFVKCDEQQERDDLVVKWVVCDLQLFNVVENNEWQNMILKFDP